MSLREVTPTRSRPGLRALLAPLYWSARARLRSMCQLDHALVYVKDSGIGRGPDTIRAPVATPESPRRDHKALQLLTVTRLHPTDHDGLDAMTSGDPWRSGRDAAMSDLEAGHFCYVTKLDDTVVAATWTCAQAAYEDTYLDRTLVLAPDEAYYFRTFAVQRGRGILPVLRVLDQAVFEASATQGKRWHFGIVNPGNRPMHMLLKRLDFRLVGHIGFLDVLGLRLNYIWGREAFPATRPRLRFSARHFPSLRH